MTMDDSQLADDLATLCASKEFSQLLPKWNRFSPFCVMRAERQEIRHTTTLAWLLDPRGSHQMGEKFLRCFLQQLPGYAPAQAHKANAETAQVYREVSLSRNMKKHLVALEQENDGIPLEKKSGNRLDILIEGRDKGQRPWAVAIEAKIGSKQARGQLPAYALHLRKRFENSDLLMLYLTVNEDEPEGCDEWVNVLWGSTVAAALEAALHECQDIPPKVRDFLDDYLTLLRHVAHDAKSDLTEEIRFFANSKDAAPIFHKLKWRSKELRDVRGWSERAWERSFWQHESLLRKCIAEVYDPSAQLVWDTVRSHLAPASNSTIITAGDNNSLAVQFIRNDWPGSAPLKDGATWNLCYHVEFRSVQQDIELKLYLPRERNIDRQKELVQTLQDRGLLGEAFHPQQGALASYLTPNGKSLKLETMKIKWSLTKDGAITIDDKALAAFCAEFERKCQAHSSALNTVFGNQN